MEQWNGGEMMMLAWQDGDEDGMNWGRFKSEEVKGAEDFHLRI